MHQFCFFFTSYHCSLQLWNAEASGLHRATVGEARSEVHASALERKKIENVTNAIEECASAELFTVGGLRIEFDGDDEKQKKNDQKTCIFLALHFDLSFRSRKEFSHELHESGRGREGEIVILFEYFPSDSRAPFMAH